MAYNPQNPNGQATSANSEPVVIASDQSTLPVSAGSLPLPTGASTAANQSTGNTTLASIDGKITAVNTGAVVVSSSALPSGAATAAKQPAIGTAGTASADVLSVQGASGMTSLKVDGSGVTQPISGTVTVTPSGTQTVSGAITANAGTNLNTSALALDTTLTGGTQQSKITDGTNIAHVLKADGTAAGQNAQLVSGTGYSTATLTLNSGSPNTAWFDMLNYAWVSVAILTNTTPATLTWQTAGDAAGTNPNNINLRTVGAVTTTLSATTTSAVAAFEGPRQGRYFRVTSNNGAGTTTLTITFFTTPAQSYTVGALAAQSGTWTVGASSATGSAVPANAFYQGVNPQTALPAAATAGNLTGATADKYGRQVVLANGFRDIIGSQTTTITSSTTETTIATAVASTFLDLTSIMLINTSATATRVDIRDTTAGSVIMAFYIPAGDTRGATFGSPQPQTAVNTNWTATCATSVADVRIFVQFIKNK